MVEQRHTLYFDISQNCSTLGGISSSFEILFEYILKTLFLSVEGINISTSHWRKEGYDVFD